MFRVDFCSSTPLTDLFTSVRLLVLSSSIFFCPLEILLTIIMSVHSFLSTSPTFPFLLSCITVLNLVLSFHIYRNQIPSAPSSQSNLTAYKRQTHNRRLTRTLLVVAVMFIFEGTYESGACTLSAEDGICRRPRSDSQRELDMDWIHSWIGLGGMTVTRFYLVTMQHSWCRFFQIMIYEPLTVPVSPR